MRRKAEAPLRNIQNHSFQVSFELSLLGELPLVRVTLTGGTYTDRPTLCRAAG